SMFHLCRYIRIEFSGQPQVLGCIAEGIMAQIRFENRQIGSQILSFQHPAPQTMNGKGMSEIVEPRPFSPSTMRNPGFPKEFPEILIDIPFGYSFSGRRGKEIGVRIRKQMNLLHICRASMKEFIGHRNQPVLVEFTIYNRKDAGVQINIPYLEIQRLRNAQSASIQHTEQQRHDPMSVRNFSTVMASIHLFEKLCDFIITENIGNVSGSLLDDIFGENICRDTETSHIHAQLPYDTCPGL